MPEFKAHNLWPIPVYDSETPVKSEWLDYILNTEYERMHIGNGDISKDRYILNQLPDLKKEIPDVDEYFHADLIGLNALVQGSSIGKVNALFNHGAGDLIEIALSDGGAPLVLPFTKAVVPVIDAAAGTIEVDPPSGLWVPKDVNKGDE